MCKSEHESSRTLFLEQKGRFPVSACSKYPKHSLQALIIKHSYPFGNQCKAPSMLKDLFVPVAAVVISSSPRTRMQKKQRRVDQCLRSDSWLIDKYGQYYESWSANELISTAIDQLAWSTNLWLISHHLLSCPHLLTSLTNMTKWVLLITILSAGVNHDQKVSYAMPGHLISITVMHSYGSKSWGHVIEQSVWTPI